MRDRIMRTIVFFDLPNVYSNDKKIIYYLENIY